jgi:hypothetical protein
MSARDSIHDAVVNALAKDGWQITHDPLMLRYGERRFYIDLGAMDEDSFVGLAREGERIAVEIKSFTGPSEVTSLEHAVGQYVLYNLILQEIDPERPLFLAIPHWAYEEFFKESVAQLAIERLPLLVLVVNCVAEEIVQWITPRP